MAPRVRGGSDPSSRLFLWLFLAQLSPPDPEGSAEPQNVGEVCRGSVTPSFGLILGLFCCSCYFKVTELKGDVPSSPPGSGDPEPSTNQNISHLGINPSPNFILSRFHPPPLEAFPCLGFGLAPREHQAQTLGGTSHQPQLIHIWA